MMICPDLKGKRNHSSVTLEDFTSSVKEPEMPKPTRDEHAIDYEAMARDVVDPELHKRAMWRTWRTFPCKKIARVLPPGFATWTDYLERGGIIDKSTGRGSLTKTQKRFFWSDQCACKCWIPAQQAQVPATLTPIKRNRGAYEEISYFETIDETRNDIDKKKEEERAVVARVDSFWRELESQFIDNCKRKPRDGQEMIDWYWSFPLKQEFLSIYDRLKPSGDVDV